MKKANDSDPDRDALVVVFETMNPATAAVAESLLENARIPFNPQGEELQSAFVMPIAGPVRIQVRKRDEKKAKDLLKDLR